MNAKRVQNSTEQGLFVWTVIGPLEYGRLSYMILERAFKHFTLKIIVNVDVHVNQEKGVAWILETSPEFWNQIALNKNVNEIESAMNCLWENSLLTLK